MKITKLEYQKDDPNRVNVYVDGQFAVGIGVDDVLKMQLFKDKEVTQKEVNKIVAESEFGMLYNFALNFLSFRPRSEWEVRFHLGKKTKDQGLIDKVIEKLVTIKQIDDESFSKWFLDQRNAFRPKGKMVLELELRKKGISTEIIKNALTGDTASEFEKAWYLVSKKKLSDREKSIRFLGTRGFSWGTINDVLGKLEPKA